MVAEIKRILRNSLEEEKNALLLSMFMQMEMHEETAQYTEEQLVKDLKRTYHSFLNYKRNQTDIKRDNTYHAVHILFSDSTYGSLKQALKVLGLQDEEKIIAFSDLFSIGPMWRLHEQEGLSYRYEWLKNHINFDDEYIDEYEYNFNHTVSMIDAIPESTPIIVWTGENAHEQTVLRYVLFLLKEKTNDIFIINATKQFKNQFNVPSNECFPLHTGEIVPEKLMMIYEESRKEAPASQMQLEEFAKEWQALSTTKEYLRIWEDQVIKSVEENIYDDYIINKVKQIHNERKNNDFIYSARLVGEIIGDLDQYIGDAFFEYRVRQLIIKGIFEIKGVPKAMRYYSVRLH
ncbi:DUF1835 domain-containing protein [Virgibacillus pantothenticus]|nr:DUF1835 domain-containing protein [Virgibacillus pantothenticus]MBU8568588.1 DUF1835 domain-containing protein [Virgibacillus pantothenticus]MBU8602585.1 DUF1835 domain-containing protein [Virgibacillus pantothenticus]MBU8636705.1 DUF1835 domain-containing protein [Virgibacillus pantothenticus]MBU8644383.1 DUF1835 domain-containing protein [Virgibacillus pantothenticus]MBU8648538.1 DUF1835 domain-containing protein [Virgibacillus pantothenticus]